MEGKWKVFILKCEADVAMKGSEEMISVDEGIEIEGSRGFGFWERVEIVRPSLSYR